MKLQKILLSFIFLIVAFCIHTKPATAEVMISSLKILKGSSNQFFYAQFEIKNTYNHSKKINAVIVSKNKRFKRWRGISLPEVPKYSKKIFSIKFQSRLVLSNTKNDFYVLLYDEKYKKLYDNSSRHGKITTSVIMQKNVVFNIRNKKAKSKNSTFYLGSKKTVESSILNSKPTPIRVITSGQKSTPNTQYGKVSYQQPIKVYKKRGILKKSTPAQPSRKTLINTKHIFASYFSLSPDPKLVYQEDDVHDQTDFMQITSIKVSELKISEKEKIVAMYLNEDQAEKAIVFLAEQLLSTPNKVDTYLSLSNVYMKTGDKKSALEVLTNSLSKTRIFERMILNQELVEHSKEALSKEEVQEMKYLEDQFNKIGLALLTDGNYFDALKAFKSLKSINPEYKGVLKQITFCKRKIRDIQLKIMRVERKRKKREKEKEERIAKAKASKQKNKKDVIAVDQSKSIQPVRVASSKTLRKTGNDIDKTKTSKKVEPRVASKTTNQELADYYIEQQDFIKAIFFLNDQIQENPSDVSSILKLSGIYQKNGDIQKSVRLLSNNLDQNINHAKVTTKAKLERKIKGGTSQVKAKPDMDPIANKYKAIGVQFFKSKSYSKAIIIFNNLKKKFPDDHTIAPYIDVCEKGLGINQSVVTKNEDTAMMVSKSNSNIGDIVFESLPKFSTIYIFQKHQLLHKIKTETSQYAMELNVGDYSVFVQSEAYLDYYTDLKVGAQTQLNKVISMQKSVEENMDSVLIASLSKPAKDLPGSRTTMIHTGW